MKRVILDVDGVSANFVQATLDSLVGLGGPRMGHDDIATWDIFGSMPPGWNDRLLREWHKPGWCRGIPLYEGSLDGIGALREVAPVVFATTAMPGAPHWMWERDQWLRAHLGASDNDIVFVADKRVVSGTVFVDDKAANVRAWHREHPGGVAVLWNRPYNRVEGADLPGAVIRTSSWQVLLDALVAA